MSMSDCYFSLMILRQNFHRCGGVEHSENSRGCDLKGGLKYSKGVYTMDEAMPFAINPSPHSMMWLLSSKRLATYSWRLWIMDLGR